MCVSAVAYHAMSYRDLGFFVKFGTFTHTVTLGTMYIGYCTFCFFPNDMYWMCDQPAITDEEFRYLENLQR